MKLEINKGRKSGIQKYVEIKQHTLKKKSVSRKKSQGKLENTLR